MRTLYNIATYVVSFFIWGTQLFSKKMKLFVKGRAQTYSILKATISPDDPTIWFHCASLGEFEQGFPVMEALKKEFPSYKIVVSFFSPSGYEIKKNTPIADAVVYLPMDTRANAARFVAAVHPTLVCFVKYEVWPNYLLELNDKKIAAFLISGVFREDQLFFKSYGSFMRRALNCFDTIFVQNKSSKELLNRIHFNTVQISGDTRFDRVSRQIEQDNSLDFMEQFKGSSLCLVCGSTWPEDEDVLLPFINSTVNSIKVVIAPHTIEKHKIDQLQKKITKTTIRYSEIATQKNGVANVSVLIIDTIGLLTKIYSYADIAYVGGGMGTTGLHNILEPATFGIPIVIGKNYENFPEAERLRSLAGLYTIETPLEASELLQKFVTDTSFLDKTGMIAGHFTNSNTGATEFIMRHLRTILAT